MSTLRLLIVFLGAASAMPATAESHDAPVVAYVNGTTLSLATASGRVTNTIRLGHPVYDFALSPDRKQLAIVTALTTYGGDLQLLDLRSHVRSRLTIRPIYFKHLDPGEKEVYADPRFSSDGRYLAFAIHTDAPGDGNDLVEASGPLAVMDLNSRAVRILKSTTTLNEGGTCFANTPMWSLDGKRILFNCEVDAFITNTQGTKLQPLTAMDSETKWPSAIGWLGDHCILYVRWTDGNAYASYDARILDLRSEESQDAVELLKPTPIDPAGLEEASAAARIRRTNVGVFIETSETHWELPAAAKAHVLDAWGRAEIPEACR